MLAVEVAVVNQILAVLVVLMVVLQVLLVVLVQVVKVQAFLLTQTLVVVAVADTEAI
jgi:hypothetical protein